MGTINDPSVHDFLLSTHHQSCKQLAEVLSTLPKESLFEIVQSSTEVILAANAELRRRDKNSINGFSSNGFAIVPSISKDLNTKLLLQNTSQNKILYQTQNVAKQVNTSKTVGAIPDSNFNSLSAPKRNHDGEEHNLPSKRPRQCGNGKPTTSSTDSVDGTNGYMLLQFVLVDSPDLTSVPSPADIHCLNERGMGLPRQPDGSQFNIPMRMEKSLTPNQIIERLQHCYTTININDLNVKMAIAGEGGKLEEVNFSKLGDLSDQLVDGDKVFLLPCTMIVAPEETSDKSKASRPATPDKSKTLNMPFADECEIHVNPPPTTYPSVSSISSIISAITSQASLSNMIPTSSMVVNNSLNSQLSNSATSILLSSGLSMSTGISTAATSDDKTARRTTTGIRDGSSTARRPSTRSSRSSLDPLTLDKKLTVEEKRLLEEDQAKAKLGIHVYRAIPPSEKKTRPTKRCALCLQDSCRRESRYFCLTCEKGFHVRCFIEDHLRLLDEKKDLFVEVRDDNFNLKETGHISEVAKTVNARVPAERAASTSRPLRRSQNGASVAQLTASNGGNSYDDGAYDHIESQSEMIAESPSDSERENTPDTSMDILIKNETYRSISPEQLCDELQSHHPKLSAVPTK